MSAAGVGVEPASAINPTVMIAASETRPATRASSSSTAACESTPIVAAEREQDQRNHREDDKIGTPDADACAVARGPKIVR